MPKLRFADFGKSLRITLLEFNVSLMEWTRTEGGHMAAR